MIRFLTRRALLVVSGSALALAAVTAPVRAAVPAGTAAVRAGTAAVRVRAAAAAAPAAAAAAGWRVQLRLRGGELSPLLASITADSSADAWSAGVVVPRAGWQARPLIEHWNGTAWQSVALPRKIARKWQQGFPFSAVGASSSSDFWAVSNVLGVWLHWNGRRWSTGRLPGNSAGNVLAISSVSAFSARNVWAFGGHVTGTSTDSATGPPYVAHFNGHSWKVVTAPAGNAAISAVSSLSPGDIWAVLGRFPMVSTRSTSAGNAVAHWNGRQWNPVRLPGAFTRGASLTSVLARSDHNIWIGGGITNARRGQTEEAANWNGSRWTVSRLSAHPSGVEFQLVSMVPDGSGGLWAVATSEGLSTSRLWHLHAGRWTGPTRLEPCRRACVLTGLAQVPGTTSVWAAGAIVRGRRGEGLIALQGRIPLAGGRIDPLAGRGRHGWRNARLKR